MKPDYKQSLQQDFKLDRQKYLDLMKREGYSKAITLLHHDKERLEFETFEGQDGYDRKKWELLREFRDFSLELWNMSAEETDLTRH